MQILKKVGIAAASTLLALAAATPVSAYTITIDMNGSSSSNTVIVDDSATESATQTNSGDITTTVDSEADSGANDADDNTGGNTSIFTGSADVTNMITTVGHLNGLTTSCGCSSSSDSTVEITNNGSASISSASLTMRRDRTRLQDNTGILSTGITRSRANSGGNRARRNTGGTVLIDTGNSETQNTVNTTGHENSVTEL